MLFGYFNGSRSVVEWIDAQSGSSKVLLESERPIHRSAISEDHSKLYAVLLDPSDHREAGVWRFDLSVIPARADQVLPATKFDPAQIGLVEEIFVIPELDSLVVRDCYHECRVRIVNRTTGVSATLAKALPTGTSVRGLTSREIVFDANCDLPCPLTALDLRTGATRPVGRRCNTALVVDSPHGPLLVADGQGETCQGSLRIGVTSMNGGASPTSIFATDAPDATLTELGFEFDASLPPGTFLVAGSASPLDAQPRDFPLIVDATSGAADSVKLSDN